eukprot:1796226-Prymnesium_polylepis.1
MGACPTGRRRARWERRRSRMIVVCAPKQGGTPRSMCPEHGGTPRRMTARPRMGCAQMIEAAACSSLPS